mgnify:CR=1 FL=1
MFTKKETILRRNLLPSHYYDQDKASICDSCGTLIEKTYSKGKVVLMQCQKNAFHTQGLIIPYTLNDY